MLRRKLRRSPAGVAVALATAGALLIASLPAVAQVDSLVIGGLAHPWRGGGDGIDPEMLAGNRFNPRVDTTNTPGDAIEFDALDGWISPRYFDGQTNIARLVLEEGGSVAAPNLISLNSQLLRTQLEGIVNGDHQVALERKPTPFNPQVSTFGIWVILDFGRLVGVHRVRFYPRNTVYEDPGRPYHNDYLRGYELFINPTLTNTAAGAPDILVERDRDVTAPVVDLTFPPRYVRLVKLRSLTQTPFEIDELEVYGTGYVDQAVYLTDLLDLGGAAVPGPVRWHPVVVGNPAFSDLAVRVRTGLDSTPVEYIRTVRDDSGAVVGTEEVPASVYWDLERFDRQPLREDTDHWSPWRPLANGGLIDAPLPRRFVQFRLEFRGQLDATRSVDDLAFAYLTTPLADTVRAEVYPRLAEPERDVTFRYAVLYRRGGAALGFDRLEIDTNAPVGDIRALRVDGRDVDFAAQTVSDTLFRFDFPLVQRDGAVLEFTFDVPVFRYGTTFTGRIRNSRFPDIPQRLEPGDVLTFAPDDDPAQSHLTVAIPEARIGILLGTLAPPARLITPNGDGVNDALVLTYNVLQVLRPVPVTLTVFDLAGRPVARVRADQGLGPAQLTWDGGSGGRPVPPGTYLWRLELEADTVRDVLHGIVGVAY